MKFLDSIVNKWNGVNKMQRRIHGIKGSQYRRAEKNEQESVIHWKVDTDTKGVLMRGYRRMDNTLWTEGKGWLIYKWSDYGTE